MFLFLTDSSGLIDSYCILDLYKINNNKETIAKQTLTPVCKQRFQYKIFSFRHKFFCIHIFVLIFKVFFAKYKKKEININIFFKKIFENFKRIINSMKI